MSKIEEKSWMKFIACRGKCKGGATRALSGSCVGDASTETAPSFYGTLEIQANAVFHEMCIKWKFININNIFISLYLFCDSKPPSPQSKCIQKPLRECLGSYTYLQLNQISRYIARTQRKVTQSSRNYKDTIKKKRRLIWYWYPYFKKRYTTLASTKYLKSTRSDYAASPQRPCGITLTNSRFINWSTSMETKRVLNL